jgi:hypothetical protein
MSSYVVLKHTKRCSFSLFLHVLLFFFVKLSVLTLYINTYLSLSLKVDVVDDNSDGEIDSPHAVGGLHDKLGNDNTGGFFGDISTEDEENGGGGGGGDSLTSPRGNSYDLRASVRGPSSESSLPSKTSSSSSKADRVLGGLGGSESSSSSSSSSSGPEFKMLSDRRGSFKKGNSVMGSLFGGGGGNNESSHGNDSGNSGGQDRKKEKDDRSGEDHAMEKLGNWLGAQAAMEDTLDVLEQGGWMD